MKDFLAGKWKNTFISIQLCWNLKLEACWSMCSQSKLNFGSAAFVWREGNWRSHRQSLCARTGTNDKITTQMWCQIWESNPGHIGGSPVLSALDNPRCALHPVHNFFYTNLFISPCRIFFSDSLAMPDFFRYFVLQDYIFGFLDIPTPNHFLMIPNGRIQDPDKAEVIQAERYTCESHAQHKSLSICIPTTQKVITKKVSNMLVPDLRLGQTSNLSRI